MTKENTADYLSDIPKPIPQPPEGQEMLKLTLLSARRSSAIGAVLVALPALFLTFFVVSNTLFPGISRWLAGSGARIPISLRPVLVFLFLVGFPFIAVIVNLLAITWFRYYPSRRELTISVRMRWPNILIAVIGSALAAFYILHLLADDVLTTTKYA